MEMKVTTTRRWGRLSATALTTGTLAVSTMLASANEPTFKLYINKSANPNNYVVLKDEFATVLKHTTEGMELDLPGVDVIFRCTSNVAAADEVDDQCTILVQQGEVSAPQSDPDPQPDPDPDPQPDPDPDPQPDPDPDPEPDPNPPTNNNGSCSSSTTIKCMSGDIGPASSTGVSEIRLDVPAGKTVVFKHSVGSAGFSAGGDWVPTFSSNSSPPNGAVLRVWYSKTPGGQDTPTGRCAVRGSSGSIGALSTVSSSKCTLGANTTYWLNMKACTGSQYDKTCASGKGSDGNTQIYFSYR